MAYCKKCGAYIPDGSDKCFACGFSESAAQAQAQADAQRRAAEEKRRTQQQEAERWAREEKQRREQQTSEDGWTRVNYDAASQRPHNARQNSDYYINKVKQAGDTAGEYIYKAEEKLKSAGINKSKALAALSYISFLFVLPYIFCADDKYAVFHAKQGLILFICNFVLDLLGLAASIMWVPRAVSVVLMLVGIKNALSGEKKRLPFIGNIIR